MPKPLTAIIILVLVVGFGYFIFQEEPKSEGTLTPENGGEEQEENENGSITENLIQTEVNGIFNIELVSNPTTGYGWQTEFSKEYLELIQNIYLPSQSENAGNQAGNEPIVGAGGKEIFEFRALQAGKTEIIFSYLRPWEQGVGPVKQEIYGVEIKGKESFCGWSTLGTCQNDNECKKGGCSGQVCQPKEQESVITTCEYRDCYNAQNYNLFCGCQEGVCQWVE